MHICCVGTSSTTEPRTYRSKCIHISCGNLSHAPDIRRSWMWDFRLAGTSNVPIKWIYDKNPIIIAVQTIREHLCVRTRSPCIANIVFVVLFIGSTMSRNSQNVTIATISKLVYLIWKSDIIIFGNRIWQMPSFKVQPTPMETELVALWVEQSHRTRTDHSVNIISWPATHSR